MKCDDILLFVSSFYSALAYKYNMIGFIPFVVQTGASIFSYWGFKYSVCLFVTVHGSSAPRHYSSVLLVLVISNHGHSPLVSTQGKLMWSSLYYTLFVVTSDLVHHLTGKMNLRCPCVSLCIIKCTQVHILYIDHVCLLLVTVFYKLADIVHV